MKRRRRAVYRDFVYFDTSRVQSILAQLYEGLVTQLMQRKSRRVGGSLKGAIGLLGSNLGATGEATREMTSGSTAILHDYAYNLAHNALSDSALLTDLSNVPRNGLRVTGSEFITVEGKLRILDYEQISKLREHVPELVQLFGSGGHGSDPEDEGNRAERRSRARQRRADQKNDESKQAEEGIEELGKFAEIAFGDIIQAELKNERSLRLLGVLHREFLRESVKDLVFKFGSRPQGTWKMLAQLARVPEKEELGTELHSLEKFDQMDMEHIGSLNPVMNTVVDAVNAMQQLVSSVSYPDVSVTPIALFRETEGGR